MKKRNHVFFGLMFAVALVSPAAFAANGDFFTGTAHLNIGTHSGYGNGFGAVWHSGHNNNNYGLLYSSTETYINGPAGIYFKLGNVNRAHLTTTGLGINKLNPAYKIDILSNAADGGAARVSGFVNAGPSSDPGVWYGGDGHQFAGVKYKHTTTDNPHADDEWGIFQASIWRYAFKGNSNAYKFGSSSWSALSDARAKEGIMPFKAGLSEFEKVKPVAFRYADEGDTRDVGEQVGVVAEELEQVAPSMVAQDGKTVDPTAFTYMLVNSVKELAAQNQALLKELCPKNPENSACK